MESQAPLPDRYRKEGSLFCVDLKIRTARQLFDARDPAPFRERDLDDDAVDYLLLSFEEIPPADPVCIVLRVEEAPEAMAGALDEETIRYAIRAHFAYEVERVRSQLRRVLRQGNLFIAIGLGTLVACLVLARAAERIPSDLWKPIVREGLVITGWVAMWKPLEVFLYEWWPFRHRIRLLQRIADAEVRVVQS